MKHASALLASHARFIAKRLSSASQLTVPQVSEDRGGEWCRNNTLVDDGNHTGHIATHRHTHSPMGKPTYNQQKETKNKNK